MKLRKLLRRFLAQPKVRRALAGLTLATCSLSATLAHASAPHGGGELHINWWTWDAHAPPVGWFLVDFVLFVWLLVHFGKKPIKEAFAQRHVRIKRAIHEAAEAHATASQRYESFRAKLAGVEEEASRQVEQARSDGASERDLIVKSASDYAARLRSDSGSVAEQEVEKAEARLRRELAGVVLEKAERMLREQMSADDHEQLIEEGIKQLEMSGQKTQVKRKSAASRPTAGGAA